MFSATLHSDDVKQFAARVCRHPTLVDLKVRPPTLLPSATICLASHTSAPKFPSCLLPC